MLSIGHLPIEWSSKASISKPFTGFKNIGNKNSIKPSLSSQFVQQVNPLSFTNTFGTSLKPLSRQSSSDREEFYEASAELNDDFKEFSPLVLPSQLTVLNEPLNHVISSSICHMNGALPRNIPLRLDLINKSAIAVPFACCDLSEHETILLNILGDEFFPLDPFERDELINSKLEEYELTNYNNWWIWFIECFWLYDNPRKFLLKHSWIKYYPLTDSVVELEESLQDFDLNDVYHNIYNS